MRLRNVKGSRETIANHPLSIKDEESFRGCWKEKVFNNNNPLHIEIGMGKGKFIMELAKQNPDINYIGIEKYSSVLVRALQKAEEYENNNIRFIRMDAENIEKVFAKEEVDKIYLNFSDPWPKERHAKRRLTSKEFFARYNNILVLDGRVQFKTDNKELFEFSLEQIPEAGWILENITFNLHQSKYNEGNIMTEYETRFSEEGKSICRLVAYRTK